MPLTSTLGSGSIRTLGFCSRGRKPFTGFGSFIDSNQGHYKNPQICVSSSGNFIAVGTASGGEGWSWGKSTDGSTWSGFNTAALPTATRGQGVKDMIISTGGRFVAFGQDSLNLGGSTAPLAMTSTDGITWTSPNYLNGYTSTYLVASQIAVNSSGLFIIAGAGFGANSNDGWLSRSTDGSTWTSPATPSAWSGIYGSRCIACNPSGTFVTVSSFNNYTSNPAVSTSTNGITWTTPTNVSNLASIGTGATKLFTTSTGKFILLAQLTASPYSAVISTSTNGTSWTVPAEPGGTTISGFSNCDMAESFGTIVLTIDNVWTKSIDDGATWSTPTAFTGLSGQLTVTSIAVNSDGKFVAVAGSGAPDNMRVAVSI